MTSRYMLLSEFKGNREYKERKAEVLRTLGKDKVFGIRMFIDDTALGIEWYNGKSEDYAISAASNYVKGIKNYQRII